MASWSVNNLGWVVRVKPEGKGLQQAKIDIQNPSKGFEELEEKTGLKCQDDRKKELIDSLQSESSTNAALWLENVDVPQWYKTASKSEVVNALNLGYKGILDMEKMSQKEVVDQLKLQSQKELEKIKEELETLKQNTSKIVSEMKDSHVKQLAQKEKDAAEERAKLSQLAIANLSASGSESKIETVKKELTEHHEQVLQAWEVMRQQSEKQKEHLINELTRTHREKEQLQLKIDQANERNSVLNKSVHKGNEGQFLLDLWLREAFYGAEIRGTDRETGQMDTHLFWNGMKIMIDAKNHSGTDDNGKKKGRSGLHSIEDIEKFRRNLRESDDCTVGILFCLHTHMPAPYGKAWVELRITEENKLEIYMNNVTQSDPVERLQLVVGFISHPWTEHLKLLEKMNNYLSNDESKQWRDNATIVLMSGWNQICTLKEMWIKTKNTISGALDDYNTLIDSTVLQMKTDIAGIGVEVVDNVNPSTPVAKAKKPVVRRKTQSST